jgi:hypothetical protein
MKKLIFCLSMIYSGMSFATVTLSWTPGEVVEGAAVSEWLIWCIPAERTYGNPSIVPESDRTAVFEWQEQDGLWKCQMKARSAESGADSDPVEIYYCVKDKAVHKEADPADDCSVATTPLPPTFPNSPTLAVD